VDRKIILTTLAAALMGFIGIMLILPLLPNERAGLKLFPWDVERDAAGTTHVFGLGMGESTLAEVRSLLDEEGKVNLFESPDGRLSVEVYFDNIILSNLRADWIATLQVPEADLAGPGAARARGSGRRRRQRRGARAGPAPGPAWRAAWSPAPARG
jgi:hypothetical protein